MSKFMVGDRVRFTQDCYGQKRGMETYVRSLDKEGCPILEIDPAGDDYGWGDDILELCAIRAPDHVSAINPSHYKSDTIECIDAMKACSTPEEFRGHLKLTVMKYLWREDKKGEGDQARVENLEKAAWYLDRLVRDLRGDAALSVQIVETQSALVDLDSIPPHTINAAAQGWIENDGAQPVADDIRVDVRWGGGYSDTAGVEARHWYWGDDDLTHWRPSK